MIRLTGGPQPYPLDGVPEHVRPGRHYAHAPITEAVIEVRCELPSEVTLDDLAGAVDQAQFPLAGPAVQISGLVNVSETGIKSDTTGAQIGHVFRRSDGRRIVQSRLNGFSFSAWPPYERWEDFSAEAWACWLRYQAKAHPKRAIRLGVRYVNTIDVPQDVIEVKDYLRTAIDLSPYLPQMMSGYFLQTVVPLPRFEATATIASATTPASATSKSSLVLDIDVWRDVDISFSSVGGNDEVRQLLEILREAKNYVFEACITDATRGLIS